MDRVCIPFPGTSSAGGAGPEGGGGGGGAGPGGAGGSGGLGGTGGAAGLECPAGADAREQIEAKESFVMIVEEEGELVDGECCYDIFHTVCH